MSLGIKSSVNRFAFLRVQDSSDENESDEKHGQPMQVKPKANNNKTALNTKKRIKRRKRKHLNSATSDPDPSVDEVPDQQHKEKWIQHDYELVDGMYDADLKAALEMSKVEFEQTKFEASVNMISSNEAQDQNGDNHPNREQDKKHKERKKGKGIKLSLEEFHQEIDNRLPLPEDLERKPSGTTSATKGAATPNFFDQIEQQADYIKRNEIFMGALQIPDAAGAQHGGQKKKNKKVYPPSSDKDKIIEKLQLEVDMWETKFKHIKKRNQQLLVMLQQGEMKDKSELLIEIQQLSSLRDELTDEVSTLNEHLEQERSRSRKLKEELLKSQNRKTNTEMNTSSK